MALAVARERKYGQASVSSDTTVHPRCLVDNNKSYSTGHNRPVFNILARRGGSGTDINSDTWRSNFSFVTSSMDRKPLWGKQGPVREIPSLGGYIYDISYSSVTPNLCAVAVGDRTIRVWDMSEEDDR